MGRPYPDPQHPNYCKVYARRTPSIPYHNGARVCLGCKRPIASPAEVRAYLATWERSDATS